MATDIKTTSERVRILQNASKSLLAAAKLCQDCQTYHDQCSDFQNRADNVNARMTQIQGLITAIVNELTDLNTNANMAFQFEWVAGRHGIDDINVLSGTSMVLRHNGNGVASAFEVALSATDIVSFRDSTVNSSLYTILSTNAGVGAAYANFHGSESLLSRVIKEYKG